METVTSALPVETPPWVRDAIFYQIFPDRFAKSDGVAKPTNLESWDSSPTVHGYKGGDLLGIVEHLDYLTGLGVSAIYLNPIFSSAANHRYHTIDYCSVDPILGGDGAFDVLLAEAHRRNIRIVLDGVFNHVGRGFYQFNHLLENGPASPYIDWFHVQSWPMNAYGPADQPSGYEAWWGNRELPKLAHENRAVREFVLEVGEHWIRRGIDGWRLDVPNEIDDDDFWREFRRRIKAVNPDAYIVGEIWTDARRWLAGGDQFDGVQNYLFTAASLGFLAAGAGSIDWSCLEGTGLSGLPTLSADSFRSTMDSIMTMYPWPVTLSQLNQLSTHDIPRFFTIAQKDESAFRLAIVLQMTFPGAPCIYYGDEVGMEGGRDPDCRRSLPWDEGHWDKDRLAFVKDVVRLRHEHPVLRHGRYESIYGQDDVYAFVRTGGDAAVVVAVNARREAQTVRELPLPAGMPAGRWKRLDFAGNGPVDRVTNQTEIAMSSTVVEGWELAPRSASVLLSPPSVT